MKQRKDGRYCVKVNGKKIYGHTEEEVLAKRDALLAAASPRPEPPKKKKEGTFLPFALRWLSIYRCDCGECQRAQYEHMIRYAADHLEVKDIEKVKSSDIRMLYNTLRGMSSSHIAKFTSAIRSIFSVAVDDGIIDHNPTTTPKPPRGTTGKHRALSEWEIALITHNYMDHGFGLCAMVMLYAGLRRGEALYLNIDRDVDFDQKTITVRGAISFDKGNQPVVSGGKTVNSQRTIPLFSVLETALKGHHGLLCCGEGGGYMSKSAFKRKYESWISFLETRANGCTKRWYGLTNYHKNLIATGCELPPWKDVKIRCHDFRVTFCTLSYEAGVPIKTLQSWMGHATAEMIMRIYTDLTEEKEKDDGIVFGKYVENKINNLCGFHEISEPSELNPRPQNQRGSSSKTAGFRI